MTQDDKCSSVDIKLKDEYTSIENLYITITGRLPKRKYNKYDISRWLGVLRTLPNQQYTIMSFYYGVGCENRPLREVADFHQLELAEAERNIKDAIITLRNYPYSRIVLELFGGIENFESV